MTPEERIDHLMSRCLGAGLVNPVTGEGAPTRAMLIEAIVDSKDYEAEYENTAMLCRRLIRALRKHDPENKLAKDAAEFLHCVGMAGKILR